MITTAVFLAQTGTARGDINPFTSPQRLVGYIGLDPRVRQSGNGPGDTGRISKEGAATVRHVLVKAALTAVRSPGPLRAFYQRIRAHRGTRSRSSRPPAKPPSCSGTSASASRTTPTRSPPRSSRRSARSSSKPAIPGAALAATATPSTASNAESSSARSPTRHKPPTNNDRRLATPHPRQHHSNTREDLTFHPSSVDLLQRDDFELLIGDDPLQLRVLALELLSRLASLAFIPPYWLRHR